MLIFDFSEHRRKDTDYSVNKPFHNIDLQHFGPDGNGFVKRSLDIRFQLPYGFAPIHPDTVFKVMNKASVIEVDRTDHGDLIVTEVALGVDNPFLWPHYP